MQVHSLIIRFGLWSDRFTNNSLVNLYSKCGFVNAAYRLFEEMPERDVVSWTSMIVGFSQSGLEKDAMWLFDQMRLAKVEPNSFTFGSLFSACATINAFYKGKQLHSLVVKYGLETDMVVGSAIVDMYSKCGEMNEALRIFKCMPERDLVSWNGMICGFAQNGEALKALKLFDEMVQSTAVVPNHVTFIGVLSACSHGDLVNEGRRYFNDMVHEYFIEPKAEHYTCMVDILGRAGLLEEAEALILELPFKPDTVTWGALLGACKLHGNQDMARSITERLCKDEPKNSSNYVLLANTYTATGEWADAFEVRELMDARGVQKMMGCSWIEIRNCLHSFVSGQKHHPQFELIYEVLQRLLLQIKDRYDYKPISF
ncbi:Pentatricopeptide repeat [Macleaya cordata]|uniref:Pentatricopeptide repeat n=1 Tax=Macleaya cordata TaxID=56857 RepID=A0A200QQM1_MACCD|nr:Pentatricopeptide repeat [Macleaya cordata]